MPHRLHKRPLDLFEIHVALRSTMRDSEELHTAGKTLPLDTRLMIRRVTALADALGQHQLGAELLLRDGRAEVGDETQIPALHTFCDEVFRQLVQVFATMVPDEEKHLQAEIASSCRRSLFPSPHNAPIQEQAIKARDLGELSAASSDILPVREISEPVFAKPSTVPNKLR